MKIHVCLALILLALSAGITIAAEPPIPSLSTWESNMTTWGTYWCTYLQAQDPNTDAALANTYYDSLKVFLEIYGYTGNAYWLGCANTASIILADNFVVEGLGNVPGYWNFSAGFRKDWEVRADAQSKSAGRMLAGYDGGIGASYCRVGDYANTASASAAREAAYCLVALLNDEALGDAELARRDPVKDIVLDHIDQWFITKDYRQVSGDTPSCDGKYYIQPFMVGISMQALMRYWDVEGGAAIVTAVQTAADQLWIDAWSDANHAMWYQNCKAAPGDAWPSTVEGQPLNYAADLNLMIAPAYAWLYARTSNTAYRDKADALFENGVLYGGGSLGFDGKHFNQNYTYSFEYVAIRQAQGGGPTTPHLRAPTIEYGNTFATFTFGVDMTTGTGIDFDADCTLVVKTSPAGATIDTLTSSTGLSVRSLTTTALSASTNYTVQQSCVGLTSDTNLYAFTTKATPAGGNRTVPIQVANLPTYTSVARATVQYDDNEALSSPATTQNTNCAGACTINLTLAAGQWWYRVIRQTAGDVTVAVGGVQPLQVQ